jgi:arylsulfatase A-like enzyme
MHYFILLVIFALSTTLSAQDQPNILLIIADDLGVDPLNGYHDANLKAITPTLDSLRAAGITFTNAAASPVCSPTRAAIMSAKYGIKNGVLAVPGNLEDEDNTVFKNLAAQTDDAYSNALIGKWHLTQPLLADDPPLFGITTFDGMLRGGVDDYFAWNRVQNGTEALESEYVTTALTNSALNWIGDQTQPWFLWLAHAAPHSPYHVPPEGLYSINATGNTTRQYIAMIEALDFEVGRMLGALEEGVRNNTLVIFVGDNGTPRNVLQDYPNGHGKGTLYQGGVRVPLIVAGKGVTRLGAREDALVHVTDIHATILEAARTQVQGGLFNSLSFYHLLSDETEAQPTRDYNYIEVENRSNPGTSGWAIRNERYKVISFDSGTQEFYDLIVDSLETNNLLPAGLSEEQQAIKTDLEAEATTIRSGWSCRDHIRNGSETGIDCGTDACGMCTTSTSSPTPELELKLYPNPATDYFIVDAMGERIQQVSTYSSDGKLLLQVDGEGMRILRVDMNALEPGIYFVYTSTVSGKSRLTRTVAR